MTRAVFLDRDGVLNELVPDPLDGRPESPLRAEDVVLIPGAAPGVRRLREAGFLLVGASNQPAAAKGKASPEALREVHDRVHRLLADEGAALDDYRYCPHRAEDDCACRKPRPGMLLAAARDHGIDLASSWMVGDTDADVLAGQAAGCRTVLVTAPGSGHKRSGDARPTLTAADLATGSVSLLTA